MVLSFNVAEHVYGIVIKSFINSHFNFCDVKNDCKKILVRYKNKFRGAVLVAGDQITNVKCSC